jgi:DNA adenine methylase
MKTQTETAKPFIKWVGGKSKLIQVYKGLNLIPEFDRYYEPFLGGGAMFWHLQPRKAHLFDSNAELINAYRVVRDHPTELIYWLSVHQTMHSKEYYYSMRSRELKLKILRAARFIYLNKTCFNGVYRVNKAGVFNVPIGKQEKVFIFDQNNIQNASNALKNVSIDCLDFRTSLLPDAREWRHSFTFIDPPYVPLSQTSNFTGYTADGFSLDDQKDLRKSVDQISDRNGKFLLCNSDTEVVRELYDGYKITRIMASRAVNCDGTKRGKVGELAITNY